MHAARRIALSLSAAALVGGSALAAAPAGATEIPVPVKVGLFPLHIEKTVDVGTIHILGGPAGDVPVRVGDDAKVSVTLKGLNPLLAVATLLPCPNGAPGVLANVRSLGSTLDGDISVQTNLISRKAKRRHRPARTVTVPIHVKAADTRTVGVCLDGISVL